MKKIHKNFKKSVELIKHLLNIDIEPFVVSRRSSSKFLSFYTDDLTENELRNIIRVLHNSPEFSIVENGYKCKAIIPAKKSVE